MPIGFLPEGAIAANTISIVPDATRYHLGVLTSNVHMAWMRTVAGRLKSDYRYSGVIVYNNFPWPSPTGEQMAKIGETAQAILNARVLFPDSSLADLYGRLTMPEPLQKAHNANDAAVRAAYGFDKALSDEEVVARLMGLYEELAGKKEKA